MDGLGQVVEPEQENALKFEMFIFDVLPMAERWTVVNTSRGGEFEPLKNAEGRESPQSVRQAISDQAADWLEQACRATPRATLPCRWKSVRCLLWIRKNWRKSATRPAYRQADLSGITFEFP